MCARAHEVSTSEACEAVNHAMGSGYISRASVIKSLNRMVELGVLRFSEVTGRGGYRRLYSPAMDERELRRYIEAKLTESMQKNLT